MQMRWWMIFGWLVLFVGRVDLWWWNDERMVGGLPVGLAFHVAFCFAVSGFFWLVVKRCWPKELEGVDADSTTATGAKS